MKTLKSILLSMTILFVFSFTNAQTYTQIENPGNSYENIQDTDVKLNLLSSQKTQIGTNTTTSTTNSVFIQQVGNDNVFISNTSSQSSNINVVQQGDENTVYLDIIAKEIQQTVLQNGTKNSYFKMANDPNSTQKNQILQEGSNLDITLYGENSLSENMQILMQGNDRSIIVRNIN